MSATACQDSLKFFGKISASVSHEIKNVFAVINEAAGLLEDFTLMAEKGMPIEPEKLKRVANSVQGQIQRGDAIVKNMNALAHSTDEVAQKVDLVEIIALTVRLATRMADMKQMSLEIGECEPATAVINPFGLIQTLHGAIATALESMAPRASLLLAMTCDEKDVIITLSVPEQGINLKVDEALTDMAQRLNISVMGNATSGGLDLCLERAD